MKWFNVEDLGMEPPKSVYQNVNSYGIREFSSYNGDCRNHWETDQEIKWKKEKGE